jgi:hypothetical protein
VYSVLPSFVLGFHGCDASIAEEVLSGNSSLRKSTNQWDWLGHGVYFWENSPERALHYACELRDNPVRSNSAVETPAVIGAVIDLGYCLNLLDQKSIRLVAKANELYMNACQADGVAMLENRDSGSSTDLLLRYRDCAVIEMLHAARDQAEATNFDSVRGMFSEGEPLYPHAGFLREESSPDLYQEPQLHQGLLPPPQARPLLAHAIAPHPIAIDAPPACGTVLPANPPSLCSSEHAQFWRVFVFQG